MNDTQWKRARSREQVETRENEILGAAEKLFRTKFYEQITMQMIARETGFSQSNLYRYFNTKEEIFLKLYLMDISSWLDDCQQVFQRELSLSEFVTLWTETMIRQERLLDLTPYLSLSLEKNSSEKVYRQTKLIIKEKMEGGIATISKALPQLDKTDLFDFFLFNGALLAGLLPMTKHSDMEKKVLKELDFQQVQLDFKSFFSHSILLYLSGMTSA